MSFVGASTFQGRYSQTNARADANLLELEQLLPVFGNALMESITTRDLATYRDRRSAKVRANRELALFSHIWNMAREWGYTNLENPCRGLRKNKEKPRTMYVSDDMLEAVCRVADEPLRRLLRLAYLTGQRPADVLKIKLADVQDGSLAIEQNKTGARLRIEVTGELAKLVKLCSAGRVGGYLVTDEAGKPLNKYTLRRRFEEARERAGVHFQLRDIRAKAASDIEAGHAQKLLGHSSPQMTEAYIRKSSGTKVKPTK